jgi:hypothetical protein
MLARNGGVGGVGGMLVPATNQNEDANVQTNMM